MRPEPRGSTFSLDVPRELGRFLVQRRWLDLDGLQRAEEIRHQHGGGLDSALLEAGLVSEAKLLEALSELLQVPHALASDLLDIPRTAFGLLPGKVAVRYRAVPFRIVGGELWVAMAEVQDLAAQDDIAAVTGRRLRPHVALEARIFEALETYFEHPCPMRFRVLADHLTASGGIPTALPQLSPETTPPAPTSPSASETETRDETQLPDPGQSHDPGHFLDETQPLDADALPDAQPPESRGTETSAAQAPPPQPRTRPHSIPLTETERAGLKAVARKAREADRESSRQRNYQDELTEAQWAELEGRLHRVTDRDDIGRVVLDLLALRFRRALMLVVRDASDPQSERSLHGWMGRGPDVEPEAVQAFEASLGEPSVFLNIDRGVAFHLGPLPDMPVHRELTEIWGGGFPGTALVMPVLVRGRLVAFLYGDRALPEPAAIDLQEIRRLTTACASAFELFLMRKKLRKA